MKADEIIEETRGLEAEEDPARRSWTLRRLTSQMTTDELARALERELRLYETVMPLGAAKNVAIGAFKIVFGDRGSARSDGAIQQVVKMTTWDEMFFRHLNGLEFVYGLDHCPKCGADDTTGDPLRRFSVSLGNHDEIYGLCECEVCGATYRYE